MSTGSPYRYYDVIFRFPGAAFIDHLLYAVFLYLESTAGLLTLGWWIPNWALWYSCNLQDLFMEQYGSGIRPHDNKPPVGGHK